MPRCLVCAPMAAFFIVTQTRPLSNGGYTMKPRSSLPRTRLGLEELENRLTPTTVTPIGILGAEVLVGENARACPAEKAAAHSHNRPFHLEESGTAVINADGTISGSASGHATHLGAFTLHDKSTVVGMSVTPDGVILQIVGRAELEAANGDKLFASLRGSVNLTAGKGTLTFEWTGGTGRFDDATGTTLWQISLNRDLTYSAVADGVINY